MKFFTIPREADLLPWAFNELLLSGLCRPWEHNVSHRKCELNITLWVVRSFLARSQPSANVYLSTECISLHSGSSSQIVLFWKHALHESTDLWRTPVKLFFRSFPSFSFVWSSLIFWPFVADSFFTYHSLLHSGIAPNQAPAMSRQLRTPSARTYAPHRTAIVNSLDFHHLFFHFSSWGRQ